MQVNEVSAEGDVFVTRANIRGHGCGWLFGVVVEKTFDQVADFSGLLNLDEDSGAVSGVSNKEIASARLHLLVRDMLNLSVECFLRHRSSGAQQG